MGSLSGGERARLHLLAVLLAKANVLILDEPTNHLDKRAVEVLRDSLQEFRGTLILVSHEEAFLRAIADQTWAVCGSEVLCCAGFEPRLLEAGTPGVAEIQESRPAFASEPKATEPAKRALSKNERFRLERRKAQGEKALAELTAEKESLERRFSDPDSVVTEDWRALHERFERVKRDLAAAEEDWLETVTRLEEEEGSPSKKSDGGE